MVKPIPKARLQFVLFDILVRPPHVLRRMCSAACAPPHVLTQCCNAVAQRYAVPRHAP